MWVKSYELCYMFEGWICISKHFGTSVGFYFSLTLERKEWWNFIMNKIIKKRIKNDNKKIEYLWSYPKINIQLNISCIREVYICMCILELNGLLELFGIWTLSIFWFCNLICYILLSNFFKCLCILKCRFRIFSQWKYFAKGIFKFWWNSWR